MRRCQQDDSSRSTRIAGREVASFGAMPVQAGAFDEKFRSRPT